MKKTLLILIPLIFSQFIFAQNRQGRLGGGPPTKTITGKVLDAETDAPMEFATITVFSVQDSSISGGGVTNEKGIFTVETRPGKFFAKIEFIAYESQVIENIDLSRGKMTADLGTIKLSEGATDLAEIEVRAEKSEMTMSLDKRVFNVGKDLASAGGTAEDILDNVPSVQVDVEGNVSLRGSEGVRILIDGKPSALISDGNSNGLRQIQGNMIDKIEVITNPSARYEAEGMAGIINIVLKKNRKKGLNGSFDVNVGYPENFGLGVNLNYRKNKFNWFTSLGVRYRKGPGNGALYQELYQNDPDSTLITEVDRAHERGGLSGNFKFGADYYFNPKSILTTAFSYQISDEDNFSELEYLDYLGTTNNFLLRTLRTDDEKEDETDLEYSLNYRKLFERKGHELTADFRFEEKGETESSIFLERYTDQNGTPLGLENFNQFSGNEEVENRLSIQIDYVQPFAKEGKFELGYRTSIRNIDNDYEVLDEFDNELIVNEDFSNNFIYDENIHAVYSSYGNKINKFSYQFGLRYEYSDVRTELKTTNEINDRQYSNLFPSVFFTYDLPANNAIQLSYSRRIRRPRFWDLNPFFTLSDRRNFFSGNPNLDPELTDSYEIGHIKYWDKGSLSSSIYYRHTEDVIQRIRRLDEDNPENTLTAPENLATRDDAGIEFTYSYKPVKWWWLNGDFNFFYSLTEGSYQFKGETIELRGEAKTMTARMTSRTTFWKEVDFQVRLNYRAPRTTTQGKTKSITSVDIGINTDILKKKGTLTLSVRDLFNSRKRRYETFDDNFYANGEFQWRARTVTLSLNYRLNQQKRRGNRGGGGRNFEGGEGQF